LFNFGAIIPGAFQSFTISESAWEIIYDLFDSDFVRALIKLRVKMECINKK